MDNKAPILQVLMSLFNESPHLEGEIVKLTNSQELLNELQKTGLNGQAIDQALSWLERFSKLNEEIEIIYHPNTVRIFTDAERAIIPTECLRFLSEACLAGDIQSHELEFIITQIMTLGTHTITDEQFIWIFDMTIANQTDNSPSNAIGLDNFYSTSLHTH